MEDFGLRVCEVIGIDIKNLKGVGLFISKGDGGYEIRVSRVLTTAESAELEVVLRDCEAAPPLYVVNDEEE